MCSPVASVDALMMVSMKNRLTSTTGKIALCLRNAGSVAKSLRLLHLMSTYLKNAMLDKTTSYAPNVRVSGEWRTSRHMTALDLNLKGPLSVSSAKKAFIQLMRTVGGDTFWKTNAQLTPDKLDYSFKQHSSITLKHYER